MMSLPLDCKLHLGENRSCFVYLDDEAIANETVRRLRASP
jgi:hypothetical protein